MKILVYGLNYSPEQTGIGKYTSEMCTWLVGRGHEVDVITGLPHYPEWRIAPRYRGRGFLTEYLDGVRVHRAPLFVPAPDALGARNRVRMETSFAAASLRYWLPQFMKRSRPDVVIAVTPPLQLALLVPVFGFLRDVPCVVHVQDLQVDAAARLGFLGNQRLVRLLYNFEKFVLRRADRVSTITEAMRRRIVEKGVPGSGTWLFPNWADTEFIKPRPRDTEFRKRLDVDSDKILVMYSGNMGEKQGLELVLDAADRLQDDDRIRFALVGAGAAKDRLEERARELKLTSVSFLPVQPWGELPDVLAAGDIHLVIQKKVAADIVMPSKLTNILAAGRPTIATACPGTTLHQELTEHATGLVTPPQEVEPLAEAISRLAAADRQRDDMGRNAREYAMRFLSKDQILEDFEAKLSSLVNRWSDGELSSNA